MYLPLSLSLTNPYFAQWAGESGRKYEFAIVGAQQKITLDHPVIFAFVNQRGIEAEILYIGHTQRFCLSEREDLTNNWKKAREKGMTHLHLRFEAIWESSRDLETADLIARFRPPLNADPVAVANVVEKEETARLYYFPGPGDQATARIEKPLCDSGTDGLSTASSFVTADSPIIAQLVALARIWRNISRHVRQLMGGPRSITPLPPSQSLPVIEYAAEHASLPSMLEAPPSRDEASNRVIVALEDPSAVMIVGSDHEKTLEGPIAGDADLTTVLAEGAVDAANEPIDLGETNGVRARLGFEPSQCVYLYAGDFSHQDGIDILADALVTVCRADERAFFVLIGAGGMHQQIEEMVLGAGLRTRCRLPGDLAADEFSQFLDACDYVVIPARAAHGGQLTRLALSLNKPVLTTHQAKIPDVVHGRNGLVAYDNPNSLVWGLRQLPAIIWGDQTILMNNERQRDVA